MTTVSIYTPSYSLDFAGVRVDPGTDDWRTDDLATIMLAPTVIAAGIALHELAGRPSVVAYAPGPAALRVFDSRFRLAGRRSRFVESDYLAGEAQQAVADLRTGNLEVLVTRRAYQPGPPLANIAVLLARPTRLKEPFLAFLSRLQPSASIIDLSFNCELHGVPAGWETRQIVGKTSEVVVDPMLDRLALLSVAEAQNWAQGDRGRLELVAAARGFKPAWIEHAARGWLNKQVKTRDRVPSPFDRRPVRQVRTRPPPRGQDLEAE
jgi:hypothetical protein